MPFRRASLILTGFFVLSLPAIQALADENSQFSWYPAVIELFTSEGCNYAPAADRAVEAVLEEYPDTIVLSCHVTYHDRVGWTNGFSRGFCNERHRGYHRGLKLNRLYTPQLLINGTFETSGDRENILASGVRMVSAEKMTVPINLILHGQILDIEFPEFNLNGLSADVWLFSYKAQARTEIVSGPNEGRVVNYVNIVRNIEPLKSWDGRALKVSVPVNRFETDGYAVVAQLHNYGRIVAAGRVERPGLVRKSVSTEPSIPFSRPISTSE
ncbi:MAG: DUF1223 domain-containing protein [Alphaproteobacteria bacterium]|nr:DUF1223 domain-containing protein [Alphaproteobacteria bacterium]